MNSRKIILVAILIILAVISASPIAFSQETTDANNIMNAAKAMRERGLVKFDFKDLDLLTFIKFISELNQKNFVIDPRVAGKVTVISPREMSIDEAYNVFLSVLEINNMSIQQSGSYFKISPMKEGGASSQVNKGKMAPAPGDDYITQVIPLDYLDVEKIFPVIKPLTTAEARIVPYKDSNMFVYSDRSTAVNRVLRVLQAMDTPNLLNELKTYPLKNAHPNAVFNAVTALAKNRGSTLINVIIVPDERISSILAVGDPAGLAELEKIIRDMDQDIPKSSSSAFIRVFRLVYADANTVATQLQGILQAALSLLATPDQQQKPVAITADQATNSVIVAATPERMTDIEDILKQLDTPRKQVLIKGLIAEVNMTKLKNAGFTWAGLGGGLQDKVAYIGNIDLGMTVDTSIADFVAGDNDVSAIVYSYVKMLEQNDAINVLSVPKILCTDNLPTEFQVGQVIPQLKGTLGKIEDPSAMQKSYDYKDTGLILKITPHLRGEDLINLDVEQSTEDVLTAMTSDTPVTAKRRIKTNVLARNGQTIILGGLMKDTEKIIKKQVPGLSYIPLIGEFFKSTTRQREKIDLLVFLTPIIIDTPEMATKISTSATTSTTSDDIDVTEVDAKLRLWLDEIKQRNKKYE